MAIAAFACVAANGIVSRTMGDTLLLNAYPPSLLSSMYVATAVLVALLAYFYPLAAGRLSLGRLIPVVATFAAVVAIALRLSLFASAWKPLRIAAYVYGDLMCRIPMLLFWSFAALTFNPRESKRLLGLVGAAGTTAAILAGASMRPFAKQWGAENLLVLVGLLLAGFAIIVDRAGRSDPDRYLAAPAARPTSSLTPAYYADLLKQRQVYSMALLVMVGAFGLVLNDFMFKSAARGLYQGAELAGFFGSFYTGTSIAALVIQLFLLRALFARGGVSTALLVLPTALLVTASGAALTGGRDFRWIVAAKAAEMILEFTVNVAAIQMLFLAIRKQSRAQVRSFTDGIAKPVGIAIGGLLTAVLARTAALPLRMAAFGVAGAAVLWLFMSRRNYREYLGGLIESIGARRFDVSSEEFDVASSEVEKQLRNALRNAPNEDIPYLLDLVADLPHADWVEEYRALLDRADPGVRVAALQHLAVYGSEEDINRIQRELEDPDGEVRRWALHALAQIRPSTFFTRVRVALTDRDYRVRGLAVAELLNVGEATREVVGTLEELISSEDPRARAAAAEAIGRAATNEFSADLRRLLRDDNLEVQEAALRAAGVKRDPEFLPDVIALLDTRELANSATTAITAFRAAAVPHLSSLLGDAHAVPAAQRAYRVPSIAARIGPPALPVIEKSLTVDDVRLRAELITTYCRIARSLPLDSCKRALMAIVERESNAAQELAAFRAAAATLEQNALLLRALDEAEALHRDSIFAALDVLHPAVAMQSIKTKLVYGAADSRAEAVELLDNVLARTTKLHVLPLFEQRKAPAVHVSLGSLLDSAESEWMTIGCVFAAGSSRIDGAAAILAKAVEHPLPEVRETALYLINKSSEKEIA
jgi:HEAT repeat protein